MLAELALGGGSIAAELLKNWWVQKALNNANTNDGGFIPDNAMNRLRQSSGIEDIRINPHQIPQFKNNTMFATIKPDASDFERMQIGVGADDRDVILYHPTAGREVLAHELGHAQMSRGMGGRASQVNQNRLVPLSQKANMLPIASTALSAMTDDPLQAAALGVGASLAMDAPQLVNEFQANRRAMDILDKSGLKRKGSLGRVAGLYATYPMASVAKGLTGAALGWGGRQMFENVTGGEG